MNDHPTKVSVFSDLVLRFMAFLLVLVVSGPAPAGAPISFAGPSACVADRIATPATLLPYLGQDNSGFPIELAADQINSPESDVLTLLGNASVVQGAQAVYADRMVFRRDDRVVEAAGGVVMHSIRGDRITADLLQLDLETRIGRADNMHFQMATEDRSITSCPSGGCLAKNRNDQPDVPGAPVSLRGYAKHAFFQGHDRERLENVEFSRCVEGDDSVVLAASQIILDHSTGEVTGRNLRVRFFSVPIFYFPTVTFPINNDRKTGFLFPTIGFGGENGAQLAVPFYWNIAPERDATITAEYLSARGILLRGDYRYIGKTDIGDFSGQVRSEIIPDDRKFGDERYGLSLLHDQQFGAHWSGRIDLGYVSDSAYLDDFGDSLTATSADYVPQEAELKYETSGWLLPEDDFKFGLRFSDFEIIDPAINEENKPYARLPEVTLGWHPRIEGSLHESNFGAVWTRFDHPALSKTEGDRLNVRPSLKMHLGRGFGYVRPQLDLDITSYSLDRRTRYGFSGFDQLKPGSMVPVFSVDSGLYLQREIIRGGQGHIVKLNPRLFYVFVPFVDQRDQPIFDDAEYDGGPFAPNRFHRTDRVGDTNRVSIGIDSQVLDSVTEKQWFQVGLAQMLYFSDRKVRAEVGPGAAPLTDRVSDLFGNVGVSLTDEVSTSAEAVWDWENEEISSATWRLDYRGRGRQAELSYVHEESKEQIAAEFIVPLTPRLLGSFKNVYSLKRSESLYTGFSLGYDSCCWAVQFEVLRDREDDSDGWRDSTEYMLRLQLKDLGGISSSAIEGVVAGLGLD